ncbi:MAG: rhomboid family intramembrane serine protease [Pseudomonadota bacterium]
MNWMQVYNDPGAAPEKPPIFRKGYPTIVLALTGLIVAVSLIQFNAPVRLYQWIMASSMLVITPGDIGFSQPFGPYAPYILHTLVHGNLFHLVMNMAALIAFGPVVALALGRSPRGAMLFLAFFAVCAIGGGLATYAWYALWNGSTAVVGASSALSGLLPAVGFVRDGWKGAWSMSVPWLVINIILAFLGGDVGVMQIAWTAHLGGLAAGFSFPAFLAVARS